MHYPIRVFFEDFLLPILGFYAPRIPEKREEPHSLSQSKSSSSSNG